MPLTVPQQISIGALCAIYTQNENASGVKKGGNIDYRLPHLIYAVNQGLKWLYEYDPTNEDLIIIGNYLISICRHQFRAQGVLALNNGGTVAPIVPGGSGVPNPLDFIVSASTIIATDESSVSLPQFIGYNVNFSRGEMMQHTTPTTDDTTYYSWNSVTGIFSISHPAIAGERFRIMPDTGGTGSVAASTYPFVITGANFEADGVTYNNASIVGDELMLLVAGYNQEPMLAPGNFDYTATGIEIIISGFDANDYSYIVVFKIN